MAAIAKEKKKAVARVDMEAQKQESVAKDSLKRHLKILPAGSNAAKIIALRLEYSELSHTRNNYLRVMLHNNRIYPHIFPTQASGRWSTSDPPLTNFPKKCINPACVAGWHEKTAECWSVRDCIMPDKGSYWIEGDLDAIEARIFALKVHDTAAIIAFNDGVDIHTYTACDLFHLPYPDDRHNPHSSECDRQWRFAVKWRGKDDIRRGIAKNFRYGTQYCLKPEAVLGIKDLEQFQLSQQELLRLAHRYWQLTAAQQEMKFEHMKRIRKMKVARTLFGARRIFYDSSDDTAKAGFNHEIQGTVVDYMNIVLLEIKRRFKESYLVHNAHDGYKVAFPATQYPAVAEVMQEVKGITEGYLDYDDQRVAVTATMKCIMPAAQ